MLHRISSLTGKLNDLKKVKIWISPFFIISSARLLSYEIKGEVVKNFHKNFIRRRGAIIQYSGPSGAGWVSSS